MTGASQGIGRATAIRMSRDPTIADLVLMARSADGLGGGRRARARTERRRGHPLRPGDLDGIPTWCRHPRALRLHRHPAQHRGLRGPQSLLDTDAQNLVMTFTMNVFAMLVLTREVVRHMQGRPIKIVNIASTAGITSRPGWVAYAASKAAVVSLSQTLSEELAGTGVRIYTISPGRTATELRRKLAPEEDPSTIMQPMPVADVIAMLVGEGERRWTARTSSFQHPGLAGAMTRLEHALAARSSRARVPVHRARSRPSRASCWPPRGWRGWRATCVPPRRDPASRPDLGGDLSSSRTATAWWASSPTSPA